MLEKVAKCDSVCFNIKKAINVESRRRQNPPPPSPGLNRVKMCYYLMLLLLLLLVSIYLQNEIFSLDCMKHIFKTSDNRLTCRNQKGVGYAVFQIRDGFLVKTDPRKLAT